jgi:hypothetical protein
MTRLSLVSSRHHFRHQAGSFAGVTGMPQADGARRRSGAYLPEVCVEPAKGTGHGIFGPRAMTNANVEQVVTGIDGQTLTLIPRTGEEIITPPDTPSSPTCRVTRATSSPASRFSSPLRKQPDGSLRAPRVNFGETGSRRRCNHLCISKIERARRSPCPRGKSVYCLRRQNRVRQDRGRGQVWRFGNGRCGG